MTMRKILLLMVLLIIPTACSSTTPSGPSPTPLPTLKPTATHLPAIMPCMVINPLSATPQPVLNAEFGDRGHVLGPTDAPVTIVIFGDYQCAACGYLDAVMERILAAHPNDVRLIYIHFPLVQDNKALLAIQAAEAADLQGKFWEMHHLLYAKQANWSGLAPVDFPAWANQQAAGLGLDVTRFQADFQGAVVAKRAKQAANSTTSIQQSLPIMFINSDSAYTGRVDFPGLDQVVSLFALTKRQFNACPPIIIDVNKSYTATLHTIKGDILLQLYPIQAPLAVNNFVFLARAHWYDGITFLRVLPGILAQTGDPSETGLGNPGYFFATEIPPNLSFGKPGVVAMVNSGPNTNGSQFLITEAANSQMNGQYTIFGQVLSGLDVLSSLAARDPIPIPVPPPGDELISVTITEH